MPRDAEATKQRILQAAIGEFAARGAAGARIDRIATVACANKQLIYAYFGSKQQLFDAAVEDQLERFLREVPFDPSDLPKVAVDAYDFFVAHPELARLGSWHSLEEDQQEHPIPAIAELWRQRIRAVRRAQREGSVNATIRAPDLLILVFAIASAYVVPIPASRAARSAGSRPAIAPIASAAPKPPAQATVGTTTAQCFVVA
jgi:AcrR family transcriptional regulator